MPYIDDSHLNFCWKTAYKKVILDAVLENNNEDLYGSYPQSTMTIHAGCGVRPGLEQEEEETTPSTSPPSAPGPAGEDEQAIRIFYSGLWALILLI